jgi:hypothetical protein
MREFVRDVGGKLELQSEGISTTVTVTLLFEPKAQASSDTGVSSPGLAAGT